MYIYYFYDEISDYFFSDFYLKNNLITMDIFNVWIPEEIVLQFFSYLSTKQVSHISRTCKYFLELYNKEYRYSGKRTKTTTIQTHIINDLLYTNMKGEYVSEKSISYSSYDFVKAYMIYVNEYNEGMSVICMDKSYEKLYAYTIDQAFLIFGFDSIKRDSQSSVKILGVNSNFKNLFKDEDTKLIIMNCSDFNRIPNITSSLKFYNCISIDYTETGKKMLEAHSNLKDLLKDKEHIMARCDFNLMNFLKDKELIKDHDFDHIKYKTFPYMNSVKNYFSNFVDFIENEKHIKFYMEHHNLRSTFVYPRITDLKERCHLINAIRPGKSVFITSTDIYYRIIQSEKFKDHRDFEPSFKNLFFFRIAKKPRYKFLRMDKDCIIPLSADKVFILLPKSFDVQKSLISTIYCKYMYIIHTNTCYVCKNEYFEDELTSGKCLECKYKEKIKCIVKDCDAVVIKHISDKEYKCKICNINAKKCLGCKDITSLSKLCGQCRDIKQSIFNSEWDKDIFFPDLKIIIVYLIQEVSEWDGYEENKYYNKRCEYPVLNCFKDSIIDGKITYDILMNFYIPNQDKGEDEDSKQSIYYIKKAKIVKK